MNWSADDVVNWAIQCLKVDASVVARLRGNLFLL